jgi:DNA helicase-2/ATP-dependent DNA helicase PcrA
MWEALKKAIHEGLVSPRTIASLTVFKQFVEQSRGYLDLPLHILLDKILRESGYFNSLEQSDSEQAQNRILNLNELLNLAREYNDLPDSLTEFLDHVALRSEADDYDASASVTLMTLHNAKGLEFPIVFLTGCEEGLFPHSRSINENDLEEERRLCYVGLTRAQQKLYVSYSRQRRFFGRDSEERNQPSRFLEEIPNHLIRSTQSDELPFSPRPVFLSERSLQSRGRRREYSGKTYNSVDSVKDFLAKRPAAKRGLAAGALVSHEKYGKGKILNVEPTGDDFKIIVQFPGLGIKKFRKSYAKLRLI